MSVLTTWYWSPPKVHPQWIVTLSTARLTVEAKSHQAAKEMAIMRWKFGNAIPDEYEKALRARHKEKWRGGIKAKLICRPKVTQ